MRRPARWAIQLNVNYALVSHACFPAVAPRVLPLPAGTASGGVMLVINVVALVIALAALGVSWWAWRVDTGRASRRLGALLEVGEGRSRFLAACGVDGGARILRRDRLQHRRLDLGAAMHRIAAAIDGAVAARGSCRRDEPTVDTFGGNPRHGAAVIAQVRVRCLP